MRNNKPSGTEKRLFVASELRVTSDDKPKIEGYAARFNELSEPIYWFREKIRPGAFTKTLLESDQCALWNHNPDLILGRKSIRTLALTEDDLGLFARITPPDSELGRNCLESVRRGDVKGMSFCFQAVREEWNNDEDQREIIEAKLFEVSPTAFPAYPTTSANARSLFEDVDFDSEEITLLLWKQRRGLRLTPVDRDLLRTMGERITAALTEAAPTEQGHPASDAAPEQIHPAVDQTRMLSTLQRKLRLLELTQ